MTKRVMGVAIVAALATFPALGDFSYQETTRITGGALVSAMKMAGIFSKQARQASEPIQSTIAIKGDRMVHRSSLHATVIDLASQTITSIDLQKKTYSVMTFEEMKQMMQKMAERMHQNKDQADVKFNVAVSRTGKAKQIAGLQATELVVKMTMEGTDKQSGQNGAMVVAADSWIAPEAPGYDEVRNFHKRLAALLNWTPGGGMFMSRPDVQQGMAEVEKESAKLDGMPVFQTTVMGGEGTAPVDRSDQPQGAPEQQQQKKSSVGGALGGALGGHFGFGRKKKQEQDQSESSSNQGGAAGAPAVLLEMTTEMTDFSARPVDRSLFEVPADFKKVQPDYRRAAE